MDRKLGPSPSTSLSTVRGPLAAAALGTSLPVTLASGLRYHPPRHIDGGSKIHRGERCPQCSEQIGGQAGTQTQLIHLPETAPPWVCTGGRHRHGQPDDAHSLHPLARTGPSCPTAFGLGHTTCFTNGVGADVMPTTARSWVVRRCKGGSEGKREKDNLHRAQALPPNWVRCLEAVICAPRPSLLICKMGETESLSQRCCEDGQCSARRTASPLVR